MEKTPFTTKEKLEEIAAKYPTPFHIYDEAGIRRNAENLKRLLHGIRALRSTSQLKQLPILFL